MFKKTSSLLDFYFSLFFFGTSGLEICRKRAFSKKNFPAAREAASSGYARGNRGGLRPHRLLFVFHELGWFWNEISFMFKKTLPDFKMR